jgi:hypothetical protein
VSCYTSCEYCKLSENGCISHYNIQFQWLDTKKREKGKKQRKKKHGH